MRLGMGSSLRSTAELSAREVRALWAKGVPGIAEVAGLLQGIEEGAGVEGVVADAEERWERGLAATLEQYQEKAGRLVADAECQRALLMCEASRRAGESVEAIREDLVRRFPALVGEIEQVIGLAALLRPLVEAGEGELLAGERVGKYELVRALGAGSFGEVWQARDVELNRYVALKLLFAGPEEGEHEGSNRFIAEARAAAALNHEHIVAVHGAGVLTTGAGVRRAYIDSLLVGDSAPTAADAIGVDVGRSLEAGLGAELRGRKREREAARIVEAIARGIAAAHARGVLHRDMKPANVLMTPSGRPLVADFGLSTSGRVAEGDTSDTGRTIDIACENGGRIVGTPAYMAPEQARGERATPLTDVFALGAVLRFLLTGRPVYSPSGRFSTDARTDVIAQARGAELRPVREECPEVARTLAAITDRAMAARPEDRYVSAEQMGADLRAWLEHRPTLAYRPGRAGAIGLWYRRNLAAATVGVVALLVIGAGTVRFIDGLRYERDQATAARAQAEMKRVEAEEARDTTAVVNQFMQESMFLAVASRPGERVDVEGMIASAERRVGSTLKDRPLIEAAVRHMLGVGMMSFGNAEHARMNLARALELRREMLGNDAPDTLRTRVEIARLNAYKGQHDVAEPEFKELMPLCERVLGVDSPESCLLLRGLGRLYLITTRVDEGDKLLRAAAERAERAFGESDRRTLDAWSDLSVVAGMRGDHEQAVSMARRLVAGYVRVYGENDPGTLVQRMGLGYVLRRARQSEEAAGELQHAYEGLRRVNGAKNNTTVSTGMQLAQVLVDDLKRAGEGLEVARDVAGNTMNPVSSPLYWEPQMVLARAQLGTGDADGAISTARGLFERASKDVQAGAAALSAARWLAVAHAKRGEKEQTDTYRTYVQEHSGELKGK